jgi:glycopeptide antibiotics resistance protein
VLSDILLRLPWLPLLVLLGAVAVGPFIGAALLRHRRVLTGLMVATLAGALLLTLYPERAPTVEMGCAVEWPYLSATSVETLANVLLFVPVGLLVGVRLRHPLIGFGVGVLLSALIEGLQAVVLEIGRACDTGDLVTNTAGAAIGALLAFAALRMPHQRDPRGRNTDRPNAVRSDIH